MNLKLFLKKSICFLLALLMFATVGCAEKTETKKKKKIIKKKVIVVQKAEEDSDDDKPNNSSVIEEVEDKDEDKIEDEKEEEEKEEEEEEEEDKKYPDYSTTAKPITPRKIPTLKFKEEKYVEVFTPEFESQNIDWAGPTGYTIVYDADESLNRVLAQKLATYFKDNDNVILEVKSDADETVKNDGKLILVGDTLFKTSTLKETEFSVTKLESGNIFFEGGHTTMVEKAVDWFRTVKRESGKVAVLTGTQENFTSKVNVLGKDYVYVWGDEFDGEELYDDTKWAQIKRNTYTDLTIVHDDPHFQYVEGGKLRISVDRYFDPLDGNVGWGCHGSCNSVNDMIFQNGYLEIMVRFDYGQGSFPALWLLTNETPLEQYVPNYEQYKNRYFNLETDIFEFFGEGTHAAANMHKWYKGEGDEILDENGKPTGRRRLIAVNGTDLTDSIKNDIWLNEAHGSGRYASFVWNWPNNVNTFNFSDEETETLYKDYHLFQMIYTPEYVKFGIDNNWYCEWPLEVAWDYKDGVDVTNNNNGFGYNLWHYLYLDQYCYPPSRIAEKGSSAILTNDAVPLNTYVDYVRLYQLPDQIAVITSAEVEGK